MAHLVASEATAVPMPSEVKFDITFEIINLDYLPLTCIYEINETSRTPIMIHILSNDPILSITSIMPIGEITSF